MHDHSARYMQAHKIDTSVKANVVYCTATTKHIVIYPLGCITLLNMHACLSNVVNECYILA